MRYVSPYDPAARTPVAPAPRPDALSGRTAALLDISKSRGAEFLDRIEARVRELGAEVERYRKPLFSRPASRELVETIAARADVCIEALAD
jgi:hypothetical protein